VDLNILGWRKRPIFVGEWTQGGELSGFGMMRILKKKKDHWGHGEGPRKPFGGYCSQRGGFLGDLDEQKGRRVNLAREKTTRKRDQGNRKGGKNEG